MWSTDPKNDLKRLSVVGGFIANLTAVVFSNCGLTVSVNL